MTTDVREVLDRLKVLHDHDQRVRALEQEIQEGPARLQGLEQQVAEIDRKIRAVDDRVKILRAQIKLRENELKVAEQKIERVRAQSSEVKTNKEFVAFKAELTNFQAEADRLQGEILKILDVVEQATKKSEALGVERADADRRVQDARARVDDSLSDVKAERDRLAAERTAFLDGIPAEALQAYERVRRSRGDGLARLEGDYCGACMEHLTKNDALSVLNRSRIVLCRGCNRVLAGP